MKKVTNKVLSQRKLVIRGEHIATLTPPRLRDVVAGAQAGSHWPPCNVSDQDRACAAGQ
jgi:hypothetical protein